MAVVVDVINPKLVMCVDEYVPTWMTKFGDVLSIYVLADVHA